MTFKKDFTFNKEIIDKADPREEEISARASNRIT